MLKIPLLSALIENSDPAENCKRSFRNFHAVGLDYINLLFSRELTAKVYFIDRGRVTPTDDGFLVNPHDHSYDFDTTVVAGSIINRVFTEDYAGSLHHRFNFRSPLRGGDGFQFVGPVGLLHDDARRYWRGDEYHMSHSAVHTLETCDEDAILFLLQYRDEPKPFTRFYQRAATAPSLEGLYQPMDAAKYERLLHRVRECLSPADRAIPEPQESK